VVAAAVAAAGADSACAAGRRLLRRESVSRSLRAPERMDEKPGIFVFASAGTGAGGAGETRRGWRRARVGCGAMSKETYGG
jgi:hypothetical protein